MKLVPIQEFIDHGYLQEVNRLFFHILGMALAVKEYDDGRPPELHGVYDYRDEPGGMIFDEEQAASEEFCIKARNVRAELTTKMEERREECGYVIQPSGIQTIINVADKIA